MSDFFGKLRKIVKEIDKISDEIDKIQEPEKEKPGQSLRSQGRDVRQYLPITLVAEITGLPFDTYDAYQDDDWEGGVYTCSNSDIHSYFQVWFARKDVVGYDPYNVLSYYLEVVPGLREVDDLGEYAYWSDDKMMFVRTDEDVFQVVSNSDSDLTFEMIKNLVKKLI